MTSGTKNNSMTSFYLFQDYGVIPLMTPHPDDVTILVLDYDVSILMTSIHRVLWRHQRLTPLAQNSPFLPTS